MLAVLLNVSCAKVSGIPDVNAVLTFKYNDNNITVTLNEEETKTVKDIFSNRRLYKDNPSCGFTEDISVRFGETVFCIACDNCPIVKYQDRYFSISDAERETINLIFKNHGGFFPCI